MYFLGVLEKLLEGSNKVEPKIAPKVVIEKTKSNFKEGYEPKKSFAKQPYNKNYVKNDKFKSYQISTSNSYTQEDENDKTPKSKPSNCFGIYVKDGDTFEAMYNNERVCFRLAGIDTPEINQPFSFEAKEFLKSKVFRKVLHLDFKGVDKYNREIVEVYEDKEKKISINKQLLKMGLATSERYRGSDGELTHNIIEHMSNKLTEVVADFSGKGMWSNNPADKVDPNQEINEKPVSYKRKFPK